MQVTLHTDVQGVVGLKIYNENNNDMTSQYKHCSAVTKSDGQITVKIRVEQSSQRRLLHFGLRVGQNEEVFSPSIVVCSKPTEYRKRKESAPSNPGQNGQPLQKRVRVLEKKCAELQAIVETMMWQKASEKTVLEEAEEFLYLDGWDLPPVPWDLLPDLPSTSVMTQTSAQ